MLLSAPSPSAFPGPPRPSIGQEPPEPQGHVGMGNPAPTGNPAAATETEEVLKKPEKEAKREKGRRKGRSPVAASSPAESNGRGRGPHGGHPCQRQSRQRWVAGARRRAFAKGNVPNTGCWRLCPAGVTVLLPALPFSAAKGTGRRGFWAKGPGGLVLPASGDRPRDWKSGVLARARGTGAAEHGFCASQHRFVRDKQSARSTLAKENPIGCAACWSTTTVVVLH